MRKLHHDISKHGQRYVDGLEKIGSFLFAHLANIHIEKALPGHYKGDILPSKNIFPIPSNLIVEDSYGCRKKEKYPLLPAAAETTTIEHFSPIRCKSKGRKAVGSIRGRRPLNF